MKNPIHMLDTLCFSYISPINSAQHIQPTCTLMYYA